MIGRRRVCCDGGRGSALPTPETSLDMLGLSVAVVVGIMR